MILSVIWKLQQSMFDDQVGAMFHGNQTDPEMIIKQRRASRAAPVSAAIAAAWASGKCQPPG